MTSIESEKKGLEVLENNNIKYQIATQEEDWKGTDLKVFITDKRYINVDIKSEMTLQEYPETILLSIGLRNRGSSEWKLPKYLEKNDIWLCVCDCTNMTDMFILSPKDIQNIMQRVNEGRIRTIFKNGRHDYFGRDHMLAIIKKSDCRRNFN